MTLVNRDGSSFVMERGRCPGCSIRLRELPVRHGTAERQSGRVLTAGTTAGGRGLSASEQ